jgi:formate dehydrogenase subunit gamma
VELQQPWDEAKTKAIIAEHMAMAGPLLPILQTLQSTFGCVTAEAVRLVAEALNLSRAEVHGVVSFYHDLSTSPAEGARRVRICRAEACQARGGEQVAREVLERLGLPAGDPWGGTSRDRAVTVSAAYCLGLCPVGPAALIDGRPHAGFDASSLERAIRQP